jgi:hypothetical protein
LLNSEIMLASSRKCWSLAALVALFGCSSEGEFTSDIAGSYNVAVTNRSSSCDFKDWVEGKEASGIGLVITQDGDTAHAVVDGVTGVFFKVALGSAEFDGPVQRSTFHLTNYGTRSQTQGSCTFTYNAVVDGELDADAISGTITYSPATNDSPDCQDVECEAVQDFSGSRPPR